VPETVTKLKEFGIDGACFKSLRQCARDGQLSECYAAECSQSHESVLSATGLETPPVRNSQEPLRPDILTLREAKEKGENSEPY